ncbi:beta-glucoside-specific PTS transporter subunit IIABC [Oceanobacillus neutriphilus]|uniref:Beta-1,6-galactofuranosyltransferase n=1 Tax=Oceanobacillus neutriphilus TaxID=531815 RepID=A0ABQ2NPG3_9BACI|nr:beta-glucoside-specific PTS transporter subunit IIABC [Oceanobacillus neutriphilus]GGP08488.1 beta-1,6-galactofuranosyltransferase [Oceanobacillus neutriphilus]
MNDNQLAKEILKLSGGEKNISNVTHCVTRLRLSVNDTKEIKTEDLKALPHVLGVNIVGSQLQVILGGKVHAVHDAFVPLVNTSNENQEPGKKEGKQNLVSRFLDTLAGIFVPIIPAIIGAGLLKGIIIFLMFYELVSTDSDLFKFLDVFSDAAFYFIPVLLAFSSAARFKANPYIAVAIAGILIHPNLIAMMDESASLSFLGIPIAHASYASSVLPIILGVWFMSYVEKWLTRFIPQILKTILVPLLTLLIVAPVILAVLGPIGTITGNAIGQGFIDLYMSYGILAGAILGATYPFLVIMGMHVGFTPVMVQSLSKYGVDYMMALFVASNSAQAGATFAVYTKTKNKNFKALAGTAALNAFIGITEPALFGVTARLKKPLIAVSIGGAIGGAFAGAFHVEAAGMGTGPIAGIPLFLGNTFIYFVIASIISLVIGFVLTLVIGFEDVPEANAGVIDTSNTDSKVPEEIVTNIIADQKILSPITGEVVPLNQVNDKVFSQKMMGEGIAIQPNVGKVVAPFDGAVEMVFETKHAIGLKSYDGCELLIHVGLDTVELKGEHFKAHVESGQEFKAGDLLLEFDIGQIKKAGFEITTPVIITNSSAYQSITDTDQAEIKAGDMLMDGTVEK